MVPLLQVNDVFSGYGRIEVLHGVTVSVNEGEIVCIIGPNGSGKSTLLKTMFGLITAKKGTVLYGDRDITALEPEARAATGISYIPQGKNIFPSLTIKENLEMGATAQKGRAAVVKSIEEVFAIYPVLKARLHMKAGNLSGGEKQILALARAALNKPRLILLDEPSIGLAPRMIEEVYSKIGELNRLGTTFAIVEQNARKALSMAHRGYVLDLGRNCLEDTGEGLLNNEEVKRLYLGG